MINGELIVDNYGKTLSQLPGCRCRNRIRRAIE